MRKTFPLVFHLLFLWAALGLALSEPVARAADRKAQIAPPPPPAQPLTVKVKRGETVEIALRIFGQRNTDLKYLIRTEPQHGKVTAPKPVEREVSTVVYTPPADLAVTRDRFTYAVQSNEGVSAAVEVQITIVDQPPDLALPGAMEFASLLAGGTATQPLEIRNRGGGLAEGKVEVGEPWKIQGAPAYRLGAGEKAVFKVVFAPTVAGDFDGTVRFTSQPETSVSVHGVALAALAFTPAQVTLQNAAGDPVRTGVFELANQTATARRVRLSGGDRLQVPAEVAVPAQGKVQVPVQTAATDVTALSAKVKVESEGLTLHVPVVAARVGGLVRVTHPAIAFGRVDAAKPAEASFELENIGGTAAQVTWEVPTPFATDETSVVVAPGEKKTVALRTQTAPPGKYRSWLTVQSEGQKFDVQVEAELLAKAEPAPASSALIRTSGEPSPAPDASPSEPPPSEAPSTSPAIPAGLFAFTGTPKGVKMTRVEPTKVTFQWPASVSAATQYEFARRHVVPDGQGSLTVQWDALPDAVVARTGDAYTVTLSKLRPGEAYGVRVTPVGTDDGKPLFIQYFATLPQVSAFPQITPLRVLFVVLVICGALVLRQRRAQRAEP